MKESRGITPLRTILQNCLNHIENLETNRSVSDNYDKEFQDLKQFSETLKAQKEYSCTEGEKEVNRKKNRYKDILPFNVSRVILSEYAGIPGSDYINANFIKGASGSPAYIASQGPLPNTVNDFWRMVVECEVQVIVMACNAQESGKHKCENYWVEKEGEEKRFGMVQICLVKASTVCPDFLVRTMRLKYTNDKDVTEERTVCQFHYSAWPDHGVPPLVRPLLDMVRLVRDTQASETLPVLVHCSAGCGRTGTICAIDFVWGLLRAGKLTEEFSLFNLVKDMRKQRVAMVQTKEQYILVHQAVRELFKEQLRVIESHPYENIDFNGVPLIKDFEEPFYDTICPIQKDEICDEKQDKSEMNDKGEDVDSRLNKMDAAPPLPRKKRPNVLFSKQEKEAENLTEKNRSSFVEKEKERTDASLSSLLGKPRIVKLRALFEKTPTTKERTGLKDRGSQTVSRSHSLGAIRKPLTTEVFEPQVEKSKPLSAPSPPTSDPKLKNSKSFSRSVPLIKRSKSLKSFNQPSHLCVSPHNPVEHKPIDHKSVKIFHEDEHPVAKENEKTLRKFTTTCDIVEVSGLAKECSKRRRSLESLMGDVPPSITWPTVVMAIERNSNRGRQKSLEWSPKLNTNTSPGSKTADMLKHQFHRLTLETEKKMNTFVSGIGIRERRNSFRQAVNKSDIQFAFRDRESHGLTTKKLLANESALTHRNGLHSKSIKNANEISSMVDQPDGVIYLEREAPRDMKLTVAKSKGVFDVKKYKLQEKPAVSGESSLPMKKVVSRHPSLQNSLGSNQSILEPRAPKGILSSKNSRPSEESDRSTESKNLFLRKLNSEIYERERDGGNFLQNSEMRSRSNYEESDKTSRSISGSVLVNSDSKKTLIRTNAVKPAGPFCVNSDNFIEKETPRSGEGSSNETIFQPSTWQNSKLNSGHQIYVNSPKTSCYKCYTNSSPTHQAYNKGIPPNKNINYQNSSGESASGMRRDELAQDVRHKEPFFSGPQKKNISAAPSKNHSGRDSEVSFSSYRKNHTSNSDSPVYVTIGSEFESNDKNLALPPKLSVMGKNSKNYDCIPWSHSVPSRSSGDMSSSEHSSDSSRLLSQYETEKVVKPEMTEQAKVIHKGRLSDSGEASTSKQKGLEELKSNPSVDLCNYGIVGSSKSRQNSSKYSKDDFLLEEPMAPPRVKRHASVTVPRNTVNGSDHAFSWASSEKKFGSSRNPMQVQNAWNGTFGVDLDAVAASMQQDKNIAVLKDGVWPGKNSLTTSNSNTKKKQHYL